MSGLNRSWMWFLDDFTKKLIWIFWQMYMTNHNDADTEHEEPLRLYGWQQT